LKIETRFGLTGNRASLITLARIEVIIRWRERYLIASCFARHCAGEFQKRAGLEPHPIAMIEAASGDTPGQHAGQHAWGGKSIMLVDIAGKDVDDVLSVHVT
jgi:hypothetical protein